jgi:hypothetical protein
MLQLLIELPPEVRIVEGRMYPEHIVIPAPKISQELSLGSCCRQLGVEELITEASLKRFCKVILPWGSRLDASRAKMCWQQSSRASAINSGPLSDRMNVGAG